MKIKVTTIDVNDQAKALRFYTEVPTKVTGSTMAMLKDTVGNLVQIVALDRWQG